MRGIWDILPFLSIAADVPDVPFMLKTSSLPPAGRGSNAKGKRHASQLERANRRKAKTKRKCHGRSR